MKKCPLSRGLKEAREPCRRREEEHLGRGNNQGRRVSKGRWECPALGFTWNEVQLGQGLPGRPSLDSGSQAPCVCMLGAQGGSRENLGGGFSSPGVVVAWVIINSIHSFIHSFYFTNLFHKYVMNAYPGPCSEQYWGQSSDQNNTKACHQGVQRPVGEMDSSSNRDSTE